MMENETVIGTVSSPWESKDASYLNEWLLVGSSLQCYLVLVAYLALVLKIGPYLMKDRAPFKLTNIILVYNIIQVVLSAYIFKLVLVILFKSGLTPDKCVSDVNEVQYEFFYATHIYLLVKLSELLETVFFVLRKKDRQVSFLHVYHHCIIFYESWAILTYKYTIWTVMILGILNSFVHFVMYSYYTMSVFPNISKYIWWKKYITSMQMIQFVMILAYSIFEYSTTPCKFPPALLLHCVLNLSAVFFLFANFYRNTYKSHQALKKE